MSDDAAHQQLIQERVNQVVHYIGVAYNVVLNRDPDTAEITKHANELLGGASAMDFFKALVFGEERSRQGRLYVAPGHFYSPIANPAELREYVAGLAQEPPAFPGLAIDRELQISTWERLLPFLTTCPFGDAETPPLRYFFDNRAYGFGDAIVLHAMIRDSKPKRLIEIGSGYSSACALDTVETFLGGDCALTFIEPHPARLRAILGSHAEHVRIIESPVQRVAPEFFTELARGDILFIDSTHVLRTGSDVCYELFEILPRLAPGVVVHIHDMFWPFEYPAGWILDDNRSWNELYAVRAFLTNNDLWEIVFFNDYFAKIERERVEATLPRFAAAPGGSLWLRRR